ncbi:MAG: T9SS type A sorting domain-containing protein [Bacteroidota bacterium]
MKNIFRLLFVVFCLFTSMNTLNAQWIQTNTDLTNMNVTAFAVSGPNLFAGTNGGVFLSTDEGTSWTAIDSGLTIGNITTLTISGTNLFAGGYGGVYLSTNNGTSWKAVNTGLIDSNYVRAIIVNDTNLVVGTSKQGIDMDGYTYYYGSTFRSTNNGKSWTMTRNGLRGFISFTIKPNNTGGINIFAGTIAASYGAILGGVFLSSDNGIHWTNSGLDNIVACSFAVSDTNLFAGADGGGVILSTNNGTSWTAVNSGVSYYVDALIVNGTNLFAGTAACNGSVFLSTNNGTSWDKVNTGMINTNVYAFAIKGTNIFAGTNGGIWRRPLSEMVTSVDKFTKELPTHFNLDQNYPNPFNPSTNISFNLSSKSFVSLKVFDLIGREVATIVSEEMPAGRYSKQWNAASLSSGIYFYRLQAGSFTQTKKLVLLR